MKLLKYTYIFLIAAIAFSCGDGGEFPSLEGQQFVAFASASATIDEASTTGELNGNASLTNNSYQVVINRSSSDLSDAVDVSISVESSFLFDSDFADAEDPADAEFSINKEVNGGSFTVTIPAGSAQGTFILTTANDVLAKGNKSVVLTITGASNGYEVGNAQAAKSSVLTMTLVDDDCPIDIPGLWAGAWRVKEFPAAAGSFNDGFAVGAAVGRVTELVLDPSDPSGTSAILKAAPFDDPEITGTPIFAEDVPLKFVTCPGTVLIGEDIYDLTFTQNGSAAAILRSDEPDVFGNGTYAEDGSTFTLTVSYTNQGGLNFDEFNMVFVKVEE